MSAKYILTQDGDSHWFVIPADKQDEWGEYCEAVVLYWGAMPDDQEPPVEPDWAEIVDGAPSRVKFCDYEIN